MTSACAATNHYMNQWKRIVNHTLGNGTNFSAASIKIKQFGLKYIWMSSSECRPFCHVLNKLTHGFLEIGPHLFSLWIAAWRHQAITWQCWLLIRDFLRHLPEIKFSECPRWYFVQRVWKSYFWNNCPIPGGNELTLPVGFSGDEHSTRWAVWLWRRNWGLHRHHADLLHLQGT